MNGDGPADQRGPTQVVAAPIADGGIVGLGLVRRQFARRIAHRRPAFDLLTAEQEMQVRDDGVDREQEPAARQDSGDDLEWRAEFEAGENECEDGSADHDAGGEAERAVVDAMTDPVGE